VINLIWEPSSAADLAGYLVLRADAAAGAALAPLMKEPIAATTYADTAVQPGVRYIYAVVAVDKAGNRSAESNRQEETARQ
jgi:fibronectin type 3 domain-containing protein